MQELLALGEDAPHIVDFLNLWRQMPASTTLATEGHAASAQMRERDVALLLQMRSWFRETQLEKDIKMTDLRLKHLGTISSLRRRNITTKEMVMKAISESEACVVDHFKLASTHATAREERNRRRKRFVKRDSIYSTASESWWRHSETNAARVSRTTRAHF